MANISEYDPILGWKLIDHMRYPGFSTLAHGIRRNGDETEIRKGGILAVGDSFTAGSEVDDHETWPAHLERVMGVPVINGGAGGYGVDQTVLRIEQLLPLVEPQMILLGILDQDITRCNFSFGGKPKPYFLIENGELVMKHNPVPIHHKGIVARLWGEIQEFLPRIAPGGPDEDFWADWSRDGERVDNNPVEIACRLIHRLRTKTTVPIVMVMQHGAYNTIQLQEPPEYAQHVMRYAQSIGVPVIGEWDALRSIYLTDQAAFGDCYVRHTGPLIHGHMSSKGNEVVARLIASQISVMDAAA